jgi:hypothetical protein
MLRNRIRSDQELSGLVGSVISLRIKNLFYILIWTPFAMFNQKMVKLVRVITEKL